MYVDIHLFRRQINEQHDSRSRLGALAGVGFAERVGYRGRGGGTSVYEHELVAAQVGVMARTFGVAMHVHCADIRDDGHERFCEGRAEKGADTFLERCAGRESVGFSSVKRERKAHVWVGKRVNGECGADMSLLGDERPQELAPRGYVTEEVTHFDARAWWRTAGLHLGERAGVYHYARSFL